MYKLGKRSMQKLIGVHPTLAFAVTEAIKVSKVDFGVVDGVRTMDRQRELVRLGRSKTYDSYHLYGLAVDLVPFLQGRYTWSDDEAFALIDDAMKEVIARYDLSIDNGYDLWGWDKPHWQLTGWRSKYDIRRFCKRVCA